MSTIRVVVSIVSPADRREIELAAEPEWPLFKLLEVLFCEHGLSAASRWQFDLPADRRHLVTVGELFARAGAVEPLRLTLVVQIDPDDSEFGLTLSDDSADDSGNLTDFVVAAPPAGRAQPAPRDDSEGVSHEAMEYADDLDADDDMEAEEEAAGEETPAAPAPPQASPPSGTRWPSLGRMVIEVKKGLKGIEDEVADRVAPDRTTAPAAEKAKAGRRERAAEAAPRRTARRATVRYYSRMNPDRMFPLLVILSAEEVAEIVKAKVKQAASERFEVDEGSVVEVEPVLPGCDCYPPRHALTVDADGATSATIWVVPRVLGRVHGARVIIRQGAKVLAEVPLDVKVSKQTLAVACGLLSLAAPYMTMGLKSLKLDYESQKEEGFPLYQRVGSWVAENLRPEWLGLGFLGLAFLLYLWMRPRRRDVFWDVSAAPSRRS